MKSYLGYLCYVNILFYTCWYINFSSYLLCFVCLLLGFNFYQTFQALNVLLDLTAASSEQSGTGRYSCNGGNFKQDFGSPVEQMENVRKIFPFWETFCIQLSRQICYHVLYNLIPLCKIWNRWILFTVDRSCIWFYLLFIWKWVSREYMVVCCCCL